MLAIFAVSLLLIACPSPGGGGGTSTSNGGGTAVPDGGKPTPPAPEPEEPTLPPKPKAWHVTTFAGGEPGGVDGIGTAASFSWPVSIAQSGTTLYVIDRTRHTIRTVNTTTAQVGTIVTNGTSGLAGGYANGDGTTARFNSPSSIVAAGGSTLYVADTNNHRIRRVRPGASAAAAQVSDFAGSGTTGHTNGAAAGARFHNPISLAVSGTTLYVADYSNHRIRAIDLAANTVSTIAGNGTPGHADGAGAAAQFLQPAGLAVSGTTLYVADYNNHRIRAIDLASPNKTVSTIAGSGSKGHANGVGTAAQFNQPIGLAVSGSTLYVADYNNHRIRAIDITSGTVRDIAGDVTSGSRNGIGTAARFHNPTGIIAVSENTLYVATQGSRIRKLEYR